MSLEFYNIARTVIAVSGEDRLSFLQGLMTQDLHLITPEQRAVYSCLLTPQGKFDFDFFVFDDEAQKRYLLDIETGREDIFCATLKKFKLRSKVSFDICPSLKVYASFLKPDDDFEYLFQDTRHHALGWRIFSEKNVTCASSSHYEEQRVKLALPDGQKDIHIGLDSLAEVNLADSFAVCYTKGCFMGQELTARMKYRGLRKKRLCAVMADQLHAKDQLFYEGKELAHVRSSVNNHGLAILPVDLIASHATLTTQAGYSVKIIDAY